MNTRSMRILGFSQIKQQLVRLAPSSLSKEIARRLRPSPIQEEVIRRLQDTEEAVQYRLQEGPIDYGRLTDIRPALAKAARNIVPEKAECIAIWHNIQAYMIIKEKLAVPDTPYVQLSKRAASIADFTALQKNFSRVFDEDLQIRDTASPELFRLRTRIATLENRTKRMITEILQHKEYQKYFQEQLFTVRNNRYVIPIKQEYRRAFPGIVHDTSASGLTLYVEPLAMVDGNNELQTVRMGEEKELERIFARLTEAIKAQDEALRLATRAAGQVEFCFAKAALAEKMAAIRPRMGEAGVIRLIQARHPLLSPDKVVPNTLRLGDEYRVLLITGSNTGGKTVAMKTLGLQVLMHQAGLFIPAAAESVLAVFREVFSDIGDEQDLSQNLSTFSGHIKQLIYILRHCREKDLVLIDELGSGTDPTEGSAIAIAILDALKTRGADVMVTTHYNDLKNYAYETAGVENAHVEFDDKTLQPTYKLRIGTAGSSHAFSISARLGMPAEVLQFAEKIRKQTSHVDMEHILAKLNRQEKDLELREIETAQRLREITRQQAVLQREREEAAKERSLLLTAARQDAREAKRKLRIESEQIIKQLKQSKKKSAPEELAAVIQRTRQNIRDLSLPGSNEGGRVPVKSEELQNGDIVFVNSLQEAGKVVSVQGKNITAVVGTLTVRVKAKDVSLPTAAEIQEEKRREQKQTLQTATHTCKPVTRIATEVNVIGKMYADALPDIERFLDQALGAGFSPVKIIHGKGSGALRRQIHGYLADLPFVKEFKTAEEGEGGGAGVTLVYFK